MIDHGFMVEFRVDDVDGLGELSTSMLCRILHPHHAQKV